MSRISLIASTLILLGIILFDKNIREHKRHED